MPTQWRLTVHCLRLLREPNLACLLGFMERGLGQSLNAGMYYRVLCGWGSIADPVLTGRVADRVGSRYIISLGILVELFATTILAPNTSVMALTASSLAAGACTIGLVTVILGRTRVLLEHDPSTQIGAWCTATVSRAILQATGA